MGDFVNMDQLHYIVDSANRYYRLDGDDNLVMASGKDEAGVFTLGEASQRIGNGKKAHFYRVIPVNQTGGLQPMEVTSVKESQVHNETIQNGASQTERAQQLSYDLSEIDWLEYLRHFAFVSSSIKNYEEELKKRQSDIDCEICDIMHLVELYEMSEDESLATVALLRDCRERRRDVKDALYSIDCFQKTLGGSNNIAKAKEAIKLLEKLDKRKYAPRRLPDLFEGMELRNREHEKEMQENVGANESLREVSSRQTLGENREQNIEATESEIIYLKDIVDERQSKGEAPMEYVRRPTVFDDRKVDWLAFAREQVDFFADAKQHICNLNIELDEIEAAIEDTLYVIEGANYNVTQGYRVFKELKDLRNLRKEKLKELECLQALTECFDCEAMAEAYRYSLERVEETMAEPVMEQEREVM